MNLVKRGSSLDYVDFIKNIQAVLVVNPISKNMPKKAFWIRHDVDYDINHAINMAMCEYEAGLRSTFFLLHTAKYFDYSKTFEDKIILLLGMGHGIGLHVDAIPVWMKDKTVSIIDIIEKPVKFLKVFEKNIGSSAHGEKEYYDKRFINYQVWSEYRREDNEGFIINWPQVSLKKISLDYEAYFLPYTHYFSDSGNNMIGYLVNGYKQFERSALRSEHNIGGDVIRKFNSVDNGFLQVLIHPVHWYRANSIQV